MPDESPQPPVLILVKDLLLCSRITATANDQQIPYKVIRDPARLAAETGARVIADLNLPQALEAAAAWKVAANRPAIGFVAHTDVDTINRAKAAGFDHVMPRSQFVQQIERLLVD